MTSWNFTGRNTTAVCKGISYVNVVSESCCVCSGSRKRVQDANVSYEEVANT